MSVPPSNGRPDPTPAKPSVPLESRITHTLQGTFTAPQHQDGPRPVRAVFTATEQERHWEVVFHFQFNGAQHAFRGTAEGSLEDGALRGTIRSYRSRTFIFSGNLSRGVFHGTHAEVSRSGSRTGGPDTGILTLRAGTGSRPFNR
jgi:hypothetical protein